MRVLARSVEFGFPKLLVGQLFLLLKLLFRLFGIWSFQFNWDSVQRLVVFDFLPFTQVLLDRLCSSDLMFIFFLLRLEISIEFVSPRFLFVQLWVEHLDELLLFFQISLHFIIVLFVFRIKIIVSIRFIGKMISLIFSFIFWMARPFGQFEHGGRFFEISWLRHIRVPTAFFRNCLDKFPFLLLCQRSRRSRQLLVPRFCIRKFVRGSELITLFLILWIASGSRSTFTSRPLGIWNLKRMRKVVCSRRTLYRFQVKWLWFKPDFLQASRLILFVSQEIFDIVVALSLGSELFSFLTSLKKALILYFWYVCSVSTIRLQEMSHI